MTITFEPFPKLGRLSKTIIITEKIDGTNAQIIIDENGNVAAGSRTRLITPGKTTDNFGFAQWVEDTKEVLRSILGPGRHFGEWFGVGIQRGYNMRERKFALFNVSRWKDLQANNIGLTVVPTLYTRENGLADVDQVMADLKTNGSAIAPGFMDPEGIVVYHTGSGALYKKTFEHDQGKWAA